MPAMLLRDPPKSIAPMGRSYGFQEQAVPVVPCTIHLKGVARTRHLLSVCL